MATAFYQSASIVSFLLLGLWWVVLTNRFEHWAHDRLLRAEAWAVSNLFLLPGVMSLVSLLALNSSTMWRIGFAAAGAFGMAQTVLFIANENRSPSQSGAVYAAVGLSFVLYAIVVLIAADTSVAKEFGLTPLETEGLATSGLLVMGVQIAWLALGRRPTGSTEIGGTR